MQVLLVDSSLIILQRLEELLADATAQSVIHKASSYKEALQLFMQQQPAIVILDINLPKNASYRLIKEIKQAAPATVVIVLSIHTDEYIQQQCFLLGADIFFDKYEEFEKIPAVINFYKNKMTVS